VPSIFWRLFTSIFVMLMVLFVIGGALVVKNAGRQINDDYDAQLIADSHTIWTLVREDLQEGDDLGEFRLDFDVSVLNANDQHILSQYGRWRGVRMWRADKLAAQSENLRPFPSVKSQPGFSQQQMNDDIWRIYTVYVPDHQITVEVWENIYNRHRLMMGIARGLITPGILILPILVLLLVLSIRHGMENVMLLANQVKNRRVDDLQPLEMQKIPREIMPLYAAINQLLGRIAQGVEHERQFMDNVAHELRTPLSVLRLQGELIAKAPTEALRLECIEDLMAGIDRATSLFDQILMLSRLSHQSLTKEDFFAVPLIQEVMAQRAHIAMAKQIDLSLEAPPQTRLRSNPLLLQIMLGALLDNALKFTPVGGVVQITLAANDVIITDNGPGIAPEDYQLVFQRFNRGKRDDVEGSGLGLAIVQEICTRLGISIALGRSANGTGLVVSLKFSD
jgi:signal transduction histidine kinase